MKSINKLFVAGCLFAEALALQAAPIRFTTEKQIGEDFYIALNGGMKVTVIWSNGEKDEYTSDGLMKTLKVKASSADIQTDADITSLYLGNNGISDLSFDITASSIQRLLCPNNALTQLDLSSCPNLVALDCQQNQLSSIHVNSEILEICDLSHNRLEQFSVEGDGAYLKILNLSDNRLDNLQQLDHMAQLNSIFCSGNQVTELAVKKNSELKTIVAYDNQLDTIQCARLKNLQHLWISNNKLHRLDCSASNLVSLKADNNLLQQIKWNRNNTGSFRFLDVKNNSLFFNSLPGIYDEKEQKYTATAHIMPQNGYHFTEVVFEGKSYDNWKEELTVNGWGKATDLNVKISKGNEEYLQPAEDYTLENGVLTVKQPHEQIVLQAESPAYPGVKLKSKPIEVKEMVYYDITFNYLYNGKTIATEVHPYEAGSLVDKLPHKREKDFCAYTFDEVTVDNDKQVNVEVKWNGPFEFSESFANAQWYHLMINSSDQIKGYLHYVENQPITLTSNLAANKKDYLWAFMGDPFHIKVVNQATGETKLLNASDNYPSFTEGDCSWGIFAANATKGKFLLHHSEKGYTAYTGSQIKYSTNQTQGAHMMVEKAEAILDNYAQKVQKEILPFFDENKVDSYFELTSEACHAYKDKAIQASQECDFTTYQLLKEYIRQNLIYPKDGYYRLKNVATGKYLQAENTSGFRCDGDAGSVSTVIEMRSELPPGDYYKEEKPFFLTQGMWFSNTLNYNTPYLLEEKANFVQFLPLEPGKVAFAIAYYNARPGWEQYLETSYYTVNEEGAIRGSETTPTPDATKSLWIMEDASTALIPLQQLEETGYSTLYLPYAVKMNHGTAYTVSRNGEKGLLHAIKNEVPAYTPILVMGTGENAELGICDNNVPSFFEENILTGTLFPLTTQDGMLFLGNNGGEVGFYAWDGNVLEGNKAFINGQTHQVNRIILEKPTVGIQTTETENKHSIYDLQGRIVKNPKPGIYIQAGKKVYIK